MKLVVGIQTCERLAFLKKCIMSIEKYQPELLDCYFIIGDDASKNKEVDNYINSLNFVNSFIKNKERKGISITLKRIIEEAMPNGDMFLYIQNDFHLRRTIDLQAIEDFFNQTDAAHLRLMRNKGLPGTKKRFAGINNLATRKKVSELENFKIREEQFTRGTWSWSNYPSFTPMKCLKWVFKNFDENNVPKRPEPKRAKNFQVFKDSIYTLDPQPFWNSDPNGAKNITKGKKK